MKDTAKNQPQAKNSLWDMLNSGNDLNNLLKRFGQGSFSEKNKWLKYTAFTTALFVGLLSAVGSFYGLYYILSFTSLYPALSAALCVVLLLLVEFAKRRSSDNFWDIYFARKSVVIGWLAFSFFLFAVSAALTGVGIYQGMQDFAPAPTYITQDSTVMYLEGEIAKLDANIENAENTKWKGTTTNHATKNINRYTAMKAPLLAQLTERKMSLAAKNETIETDTADTVKQVAMWSVLFYLLLELMFEASMAFCCYYDLRRMLEKLHDRPEAAAAILGNYAVTAPALFAAPTPQQITAPTPSTDPLVLAMLQDIQSNQPKPTAPTVVRGFQPKQNGETPPPPRSETPRAETGETVEAQLFQPETARAKQAQRNRLNPLMKRAIETETEIVFEDSNEKYLRQQYKLAWRRLATQKNPATPKKNLETFGKKLEGLGYQILTIEEPRDVIFKTREGSYFGNKRLVEAHKDVL